ncbi:hypothetical protein AB0B10_26250 [Micromonospora arborensis]|uniref:hypothetical protein n=1 Tax=Micromonospora arborensis TaxID=2116518 RepID=UPI003401455A
MRRSRTRIELPVGQWYSNGWAVEKRKGVRDGYEVTYSGEFVAAVIVTRAGWKWTARNPRSLSYRRPWVWSEQIYPTWQEAVAAYAAAYRRRVVGRGSTPPGEWRASSLLRGRPWSPRPVHDNFDEPSLREANPEGAA